MVALCMTYHCDETVILHTLTLRLDLEESLCQPRHQISFELLVSLILAGLADLLKKPDDVSTHSTHAEAGIWHCRGGSCNYPVSQWGTYETCVICTAQPGPLSKAFWADYPR